MKKILFVCSGNTCRSPMAQGIFNKIAKEKSLVYTAESAGIITKTGLPYSENSVTACKDFDVDITDGKSVSILDFNLSDYDYFIPMSVSHGQALVAYGVPKDKIIILKSTGISDPYGGDLQIYKDCCQEIYQCILKLVEKL